MPKQDQAAIKLASWKPEPTREQPTGTITLTLQADTLARIEKLAMKHKLAPEAYLGQYIEFVSRPTPRKR